MISSQEETLSLCNIIMVMAMWLVSLDEERRRRFKQPLIYINHNILRGDADRLNDVTYDDNEDDRDKDDRTTDISDVDEAEQQQIRVKRWAFKQVCDRVTILPSLKSEFQKEMII